jgi:inner membrane protein
VDNLTHTLVGLLLAEAAFLPLPRVPSPRVRTHLRLASVLANNFPDLDFLYAQVTPGKLGYLVHHRGHTHTLIGGLLLGGLTLGLIHVWARLRKKPFSWEENWALATLSLLGPLLHVAMDALNNYGVHPFWPVKSQWFYGDTVFIIEPWFWVFLLPPLLFFAEARWARWAYGVILAGAVISTWILPIVGGTPSFILTVASALVLGVARRVRPVGKIILGFTGCIVAIVAFHGASGLARAKLLDAIESTDGATGGRVAVVDAILTPAPASLICWQGIVVGRRGDNYTLDVAMVSIAPGMEPAKDCGLEPTGLSLGMKKPVRRSTSSVRFQGEHHAPLTELTELARNNCYARAFFTFSRAPFWLARGSKVYLGDLRYDRSSDPGFAELEVPARPTECPPWVPSWIPPRRDLLRPR